MSARRLFYFSFGWVGVGVGWDSGLLAVRLGLVEIGVFKADLRLLLQTLRLIRDELARMGRRA